MYLFLKEYHSLGVKLLLISDLKKKKLEKINQFHNFITLNLTKV